MDDQELLVHAPSPEKSQRGREEGPVGDYNGGGETMPLPADKIRAVGVGRGELEPGRVESHFQRVCCHWKFRDKAQTRLHRH